MERQIYRSFTGQIASCVGASLNLILLIFTYKFTPKQMQDYAKIIRLHCLIDSFIDIFIFVAMNVSFVCLNFVGKSFNVVK